jgi:hypothetical protein
MTDPVHIAAERLLNYIDADERMTDKDISVLFGRPYFASLIDELRGTLSRQTRLHVFDEAEHDPASCKYCAPIPAKRSAASALHRGC